MAKGKRTCKILKEIRRQIAEANDIEYVVEECQYKGDCLGTCPKCEAEVRYLEEQLHQRQLLGKAAMVAGISAGLLTMSSCGNEMYDQMSVSDKEVRQFGIRKSSCSFAAKAAWKHRKVLRAIATAKTPFLCRIHVDLGRHFSTRHYIPILSPCHPRRCHRKKLFNLMTQAHQEQ